MVDRRTVSWYKYPMALGKLGLSADSTTSMNPNGVDLVLNSTLAPKPTVLVAHLSRYYCASKSFASMHNAHITSTQLRVIVLARRCSAVIHVCRKHSAVLLLTDSLIHSKAQVPTLLNLPQIAGALCQVESCDALIHAVSVGSIRTATAGNVHGELRLQQDGQPPS